jgi:uncharacterized protein YciI
VTGEIPDGLAIERIWVVEATYGPDAAERRPAVRAQHLARIAELRDSGTIVEAGAFTDMSASLILVRAQSEEAALAVVEADIYFRTKVWIGFRIRAFGRAVRSNEIQPD